MRLKEPMQDTLDITEYKENIKNLNVEILRLKDALSKSMDPVELADIKAPFIEYIF